MRTKGKEVTWTGCIGTLLIILFFLGVMGYGISRAIYLIGKLGGA